MDTSTTPTSPAPSVTPPPGGSIVVGVDGSPGADQAFSWAVHQAGLEHRLLTVLHSAHLTARGDAGLAGLPGVDMLSMLDDLRYAGRQLLANAVQRAELADPAVVVHTVLGADDPRADLLRLAEDAALVVVGSRGRGALASLLLGSVSLTVSKHAACPVVVVRHEKGAPDGLGVLVGVDGTAGSAPAVELAYRTASSRSLPLTAMHVFWDDPDPTDDERVVADDEPGLEDLRALVAESVAGMGEKFPDVDARVVLVRGHRDRELIKASATMDLLVVGSRQRGAINDFVHGAISPTIVEHAHCDVAVVPALATHG